MQDTKALKILFDTYWSSKGWILNPKTKPEEYLYAISKGYMFKPIQISHEKAYEWLKRSLALVSLQKVSDAFLASLSSRRLEWRSALGSYAIARVFPQHRSFVRRGGFHCDVCGFIGRGKIKTDLSILNFERHKWGGVRHTHLEYIAFDLQLHSNDNTPEPSAEDLKIFRQIISVARKCEPDARARDLEKRLANVLDSNKSERETLIQILVYCGILQPQNRPGYFDGFIEFCKREIPPVNKIDWEYPISWWRGKDRINQQAFEYYFPQLSKQKS